MDKITTVQCVICSTTFQPRRNVRDGIQKCCSNKCRGVLRSQAKTFHPVTCRTCGQTFKSLSRGKTGLRKYCSPKCASIGYKQNAADPTLIENRLLSKRSINPVNGCWEWTGKLTRFGYGQTKVSGVNTSAHRLSAHLYLDMALNSEVFVCHTCDNPACFNPDHLYLGDARTNASDRQLRHRGGNVSGERHGMAKLTEAKAQEVIQLLSSGRSHIEIANLYGVQRVTITCISIGRTWKHLAR